MSQSRKKAQEMIQKSAATKKEAGPSSVSPAKNTSFEFEHFKQILQRQQNHTLNACLNWIHPLKEATVEPDEETLAFLDRQRLLKGKGVTTDTNKNDDKLVALGRMNIEIQRQTDAVASGSGEKNLNESSSPLESSKGYMEVEVANDDVMHTDCLKTASHPFVNSSQ